MSGSYPQTIVCPAKAGVFSKRQSRQGKNQSPVVWSAGGKETELLESDDKAVIRTVSEFPGCSESEHIGGLDRGKSGGRAISCVAKAA